MFPEPVRYDPRRLFIENRPEIAARDRKFRIGIAVGAADAAAWTLELVDFLGKIPQFELFLCPQAGVTFARTPPSSWLASQLMKRSIGLFDPCGPAPLPSLPAAGEEDEALDLVVCVAPEPIFPDVATRYGCLSLRLGERNFDPPYWGEMIARDPVSRLMLRWQENPATTLRLVRTAEVATRKRVAFTRNADWSLLVAAQLFADVALSMMEEGPDWVARARELPEAPTAPTRRYPTTLECAGFARREFLRARKTQKTPARQKGWFCALRRNSAFFYHRLGHFDGSGFEDIPMPAGSQMADPFVIEDNGQTWLFYEEVPAGTLKGRLSCFEIPHAGQPLPAPFVVLELETHLSYPCIFRHEGEFFMIPESCATQDLRLYRATRFPYEWQLECLLLENIPVTDTTPLWHDNEWYFFTTTMPPVQQTVLFTSAKLGGRLRLHRDSPVSCSDRNTRAAGHFFRMGGRLIRPTQDCVGGYGYGMRMNEVTRLSPSQYAETEVDYIGPLWRQELLGTHTLSWGKDVEVIDGRRYIAETTAR